jgi:hypothetical protein
LISFRCRILIKRIIIFLNLNELLQDFSINLVNRLIHSLNKIIKVRALSEIVKIAILKWDLIEILNLVIRHSTHQITEMRKNQIHKVQKWTTTSDRTTSQSHQILSLNLDPHQEKQTASTDQTQTYRVKSQTLQ